MQILNIQHINIRIIYYIFKIFPDIKYIRYNFQIFSMVINKMKIDLKLRRFINHIKIIFNYYSGHQILKPHGAIHHGSQRPLPKNHRHKTRQKHTLLTIACGFQVDLDFPPLPCLT